MSTKKTVRLEKKEAELYEKQGMNAARRVGLMAVLAAALAGPVAVVPMEDPRRPREEQAWHPDTTGHAAKGAPPTSGPTKPTVFLSKGAKPNPNLYLRKVRNGPGILSGEVYEYGNRLKDRQKELEALMRDLGIKVSHRQVKRIMRGFMPPALITWLDTQKALAEAKAAE